MKIVKGILLVVGVIVALILVVAIFLPGKAVVSRNIEVNKPIETVYSFATNYQNYAEWNVWSRMDPEAETGVTGNPGEVGQVWSWDGDVIGKGTLTLLEREPYSSMKGELVFISPMQGLADDIWRFESLENGTRINWTFETELGYPIGRFFGLMMEGQLGPQLEEGLTNLKIAIESVPDSTLTEEENL